MGFGKCFFLFWAFALSAASPLENFRTKLRSRRQSFGPSETIVVPHDRNQPCPIVVAPVDITGGGYFGRPVQAGTWWQGYGPKTGPFFGGVGGNFGLMHNFGFDVDAGHQVVPDYSKDCNNQVPQTPPPSFRQFQKQTPQKRTTPVAWKPFVTTKRPGQKLS